MSEQPKRSSRKKWLILTLAVLVAVVGFWIGSRSRNPKTTYREITVQRGDLAVIILATGTVQPENRLEIKPPIAGRVEQVLVKEGQSVSKGQILAWMSSTERAALLDAARAEGAEELKRWENLYRPTPVVAPIRGTIILRNVEPGQTFTSTDAILVMSDRLTVKAQVDETDISQIKLGQPAEMILDAYSDQKIAAKVDQIAFEAKTVNNVTTYLVDVLPESTPETMRSGMTANVSFTTQSKKDVLMIPSEAIRFENGAASVLAPNGEGQPSSRSIKTGLTDGKRTEILSGLSENDRVLVPQFEAKKGRAQQSSSPFSPMGTRGGGRGGR